MISARDKHHFGSRIADCGFKEQFRLIILSLIFLLPFSFAFAQDIKLPARPDPPRLVNDFAGMLSTSDADALEDKLVTYSKATSSQIAVVIIPTLDGADRAQYATELFHKWGIGTKGKDNGVLLFIAKDDRKLFIATGRGVEEFLPDAICERIIQENIRPEFKAGRYAQGINAGIDQMQARLSGQFKGDQNAEPPIKFQWKWIIIGIIIIIVLFSIFGGGNNGETHSSSGSSGLWFLLGALSSGGGRGGDWGGGGGGGSSGGFGGFGGGDSGGGGAGGDW
ncbi:MAG: YgcG family protein [Bacteroidetes bacterium]|nr:YgcG family protein [Bacteroidota bacterium]